MYGIFQARLVRSFSSFNLHIHVLTPLQSPLFSSYGAKLDSRRVASQLGLTALHSIYRATDSHLSIFAFRFADSSPYYGLAHDARLR